MRQIRIYVEGGGDNHRTQAPLRQGFEVFFRKVRQFGRFLKIIPCGTVGSTIRDFGRALHSHPDAYNILLVDAECRVSAASPWHHLERRPENQCANPGVPDEHCHLMVQIMEAWLIADREKLREYYGQGFHEGSLPGNPNVEEIDKQRVFSALELATRDTKKQKYDKTRDAPRILKMIRPSEVRACAPFCERMFRTLEAEIDAA